mgnify:CR=1 FL=1
MNPATQPAPRRDLEAVTAREQEHVEPRRYQADLARYEHEQARWAEVWAASGVSPPPPSGAVKPRPPEGGADEVCDECGDSGNCPWCDAETEVSP